LALINDIILYDAKEVNAPTQCRFGQADGVGKCVNKMYCIYFLRLLLLLLLYYILLLLLCHHRDTTAHPYRHNYLIPFARPPLARPSGR